MAGIAVVTALQSFIKIAEALETFLTIADPAIQAKHVPSPMYPGAFSEG